MQFQPVTAIEPNDGIAERVSVRMQFDSVNISPNNFITILRSADIIKNKKESCIN
jgi:hypothetical protein